MKITFTIEQPAEIVFAYAKSKGYQETLTEMQDKQSTHKILEKDEEGNDVFVDVVTTYKEPVQIPNPQTAEDYAINKVKSLMAEEFKGVYLESEQVKQAKEQVNAQADAFVANIVQVSSEN